jgi:hypothetical protein
MGKMSHGKNKNFSKLKPASVLVQNWPRQQQLTIMLWLKSLKFMVIFGPAVPETVQTQVYRYI